MISVISCGKTFHNCTCLLMAGLFFVGSPVMAGDPAPIEKKVDVRGVDVVLNEGGLLEGTLLNTAAQPIAGATVRVVHNDKTVATALSNDKGKFAIKGLRNGVHVVQAGTASQIVRLWGANAAPPNAVENLAIVVDFDVVRGQLALGALGGGAGTTVAATAAVGLVAAGGYLAYDEVTKKDNPQPEPASP